MRRLASERSCEKILSRCACVIASRNVVSRRYTADGHGEAHQNSVSRVVLAMSGSA